MNETREVLELNERYREAQCRQNGYPYTRPKCLRCQDSGLVKVGRRFHQVDEDGTLNQDDARFARCPDCNLLAQVKAEADGLRRIVEGLS